MLNCIRAKFGTEHRERGRSQVGRLQSQQIDHWMTGKWFRRLVEHAPDAILVLTNERVSYVNPAGVQCMAARSSDEMIGRHIGDVFDSGAIPIMRLATAAPRDINPPIRSSSVTPAHRGPPNASRPSSTHSMTA